MIKILIPVAILSIALIIQATFTINAKKETQVYKVKCDSLLQANDSMYWKLFPIEVELNRYEVAYDIFMERNPKAASQYGDIISNETE